MKYATAAGFRMALERRIPEEAAARGISITRLRKEIVFERLLARLMVAAPGRWVLKGGLALDFRFGSVARATLDMDLGRTDDVQTATRDLQMAGSTDLGDHFVFTVQQTDRLDQLTTGTAVRYTVLAELAGRRFEQVVVDIGFEPALIDAPDSVVAPDLLRFADIDPVSVPVLPLELHVAEKVHAYTRQYEGGASSRVKDLVDLVLICSHTPFAASELRHALVSTFESRTSHTLPEALPAPAPDWVTAYQRLARGVGISEDITSGYRLVSRFLNAVLVGEPVADEQWDPVTREWRQP